MITMMLKTFVGARARWRYTKRERRYVLHTGITAWQAFRSNLRWPCLWAAAGLYTFIGFGSKDPALR